MLKDKIIEIAAFLETDEEVNENSLLLQNIVKTVYENRNALKRSIMQCSVNAHNFAVITLNISKISKKKQKRYGLDCLFNGAFRLYHCTYCGCLYLTYFPYTYRGSGGCVGRSYECVSCRNIKDKYVHQISDVRRKSGANAAKQYQLDLE